MEELHKRPYSGHPGYQKMITMTSNDFFWPNMKKKIAEYLARCMECQQVKAEHQHIADYYNHYPFLNGNEKVSPWIS